MQQPFKRRLFSVLAGGLALTASVLLIGCGDDDGDGAASATSSDLANMQYEFSDGAAFGVANQPVTMSYGDFTDNTGTFTLTSTSVTASGTVTMGSCNHLVEVTNNPSMLPVGTQINCDVCQIEDDGTMFATCGEGNKRSSSSSRGPGAHAGRPGNNPPGNNPPGNNPPGNNPPGNNPPGNNPPGTGSTGSGGGSN